VQRQERENASTNTQQKFVTIALRWLIKTEARRGEVTLCVNKNKTIYEKSVVPLGS
jgi:hypothetical protein